ncbi:hypothetical protein ANCCAN_12661 [Ancylostoma caninum]|uniref:Uncharacterized protein n=1 Tax=Ancylostoma caninum TaxID=29170 RepID=A0A368GAE7_ANCCA|nr:hypothetical protein ANCCAN_12661 [Ancylostoma caninum]
MSSDSLWPNLSPLKIRAVQKCERNYFLPSQDGETHRRHPTSTQETTVFFPTLVTDQPSSFSASDRTPMIVFDKREKLQQRQEKTSPPFLKLHDDLSNNEIGATAEAGDLNKFRHQTRYYPVHQLYPALVLAVHVDSLARTFSC